VNLATSFLQSAAQLFVFGEEILDVVKHFENDGDSREVYPKPGAKPLDFLKPGHGGGFKRKAGGRAFRNRLYQIALHIFFHNGRVESGGAGHSFNREMVHRPPTWNDFIFFELTDTTEFVVPKSIPIDLAILSSPDENWRGAAGPARFLYTLKQFTCPLGARIGIGF
jgi:hypothetical protein